MRLLLLALALPLALIAPGHARPGRNAAPAALRDAGGRHMRAITVSSVEPPKLVVLHQAGGPRYFLRDSPGVYRESDAVQHEPQPAAGP